MTSLKGEPFNLVKGLPATDNNYQMAYDIIINRYQNKRALAMTYFSAIYDLSAISKQSFKELRHLLEVFFENLAALRSLDFDVNSWHFLLFNIMLKKLDIKSRTDFEIQHSSTSIPTFKMLSTFLQNTAKDLESAQNMTPSTSSVPNYQSRSFNKLSQVSGRKPPLALVNTPPDEDKRNTSHKSPCIICSHMHALYRCHVFLSKSPKERLNFVKQHNLCTNCL